MKCLHSFGLLVLIVVALKCTTGELQASSPLIGSAVLHEGPDPVAHWIMNGRTVVDGKLTARLGPNGMISGQHALMPNDGGLLLSGADSQILVADNLAAAKAFLPKRDMTVSCRVSINERKKWGGIVGCLQDNANYEKGWVVGYDQRHFYFGLATTGTNDGDGQMTYLRGKTDYQVGRYYNVVAIYDGAKMQLFVNGELDAESEVQHGDVLYPESAPFVLGAYRDKDEHFPHNGRIYDVSIYDMAAKQKWVSGEFEHHKKLTERTNLDDVAEEFKMVVPPFLHMADQQSIVVGWQTTTPGTSLVRFGETAEVKQTATGQDDKIVHHVQITGLKPETQYFYQVVSRDSQEKLVEGPVLTFQTACKKETPYAFAVISDTQGNPAVSGKIAEMAWAQRPGFLIHPGDLVSTGTNDSHWTEQFFPSMKELVGRVPMYPVLGNHEQNAQNYYDYFQLPEPEYYYDFKYGNAHFFMIDTNKNVGPDTDQYKWLAAALEKSDARWKFVVHHHPVFSSDENDYGDLWKTNKSTRGDARLKPLRELYDKHKVDIVWNGHIHSYERTWPILNNTATTFNKGTIYMVTGGGGGHLETPGPFRPFFQNNVKHGHHYCMVYVNGDKLQFKAFDLEGKMFDFMELDKK